MVNIFKFWAPSYRNEELNFIHHQSISFGWLKYGISKWVYNYAPRISTMVGNPHIIIVIYGLLTGTL